MGQRPWWHHFSKLPVSFLPPCHFPAPEFKQKEECTIRGRNLIQISIQEDPWNLPNSIKTLVDNIQRYVEGQSAGKAVTWRSCGLWFLAWNMGGSAVGPPLCPCPSRPRERTERTSAPFSGPWDSTHVVRELLTWGAQGRPHRIRRLRRPSLFLPSFQSCGFS